MSKRFLSIVLVLLSIVAISCKKRRICAAYSSAFVYDPSHIQTYFTPFGMDSMPSDKKSDRFNNYGLVNKSGKRNDKELENIDVKNLKKVKPTEGDSALMGNHNDSLGSILDVKTIIKANPSTDQDAYDYYVGSLLKEYQAKTKSTSATDTTSADSGKKKKKQKKNKDKTSEEEGGKKEKKKKEKDEGKKEDEFDFDIGDM